MEPVHVAIVCFSRSWGGLELKLIELAQALRARSNVIALVVPPDSPMQWAAREAGITVIPVQPRFRYLDIMTAARISRALKPTGIRTLLVGQSRDVSTALLAKRLLGHGRLVFLQQMQFGIRKRDLFHRWAYGGIDRWLTLTAGMRQSVLANTTVSPDRVTVFPLGSDLTRFDPALHEKSAARASFGLPQERIIIAVVGRIDPQKGQDVFLRTVPGLCARRGDLLFLIVGEETKGEAGYRAQLADLQTQLGIGDAIRFLPFTQSMPQLLSAIDVLVLPSLHETFGYIVVEAMAMGKPVVGTNAGGVPEIIEDEQTGYLVPPGDAWALERRISDVIEQPDRYAAMSRKARESAVRRFSLAEQLPKLEALLSGS